MKGTSVNRKKNCVFIATSLDGFIADKDGGIDWLHSIENPENDDMGYVDFIKGIDALIMGRTTFETVCNFDVDWPYSIPVFVLSNTLVEIPESHRGLAFLVSGTLSAVLKEIHEKNFHRLYIDGGLTIQNFMKAGLIDEIVITIVPVLLGGGVPLFAELENELEFDLVDSKVYLTQFVQNHYKRRG